MHRINLILAITLLLGITACTKDIIELETNFLASKNLNQTARGKSASVIVKGLFLSDIESLPKGTFFQIFSSPKSVLGDSLLKQVEWTIHPKEKKKVLLEFGKEAKYLVFVGGFRKGETGIWKVILPIDDDLEDTVDLSFFNQSIKRLATDEAKDRFVIEEMDGRVIQLGTSESKSKSTQRK